MADLDNLETLSNAELRAICLQQGLPNVPITDSSRKILIKKLRALADPAAQKKVGRRDTIAAVEKAVPPAKSKDAEDDLAKRRANRRTIAATPSNEPALVKALPVPPVPEVRTTPASIAGRRRSAVRDQVVPPTTHPAPAAPAEHPTVIIESDEEDDMLALAAAKAEQQSKFVGRDSPAPKPKPAPQQRSRAASLSKSELVTTTTKTTTSTSSYNRGMTPVLEQEPIASIAPIAPVAPVAPVVVNEAVHQPQHFKSSSFIATASSSYDKYDVTSARSGSYADALPAQKPIYVGTSLPEPAPSSRYSSIIGSNYAKDYSPSLRRSVPASTLPARSYYSNEFSDDPDTAATPEDSYETPFLSNFARNLERLKVDPIATASSEQPRHRLARHTMYEAPTKRRSIESHLAADDSLAKSFRQLCAALDRKYHIKLMLLWLLVIFMLLFLYVLLTP